MDSFMTVRIPSGEMQNKLLGFMIANKFEFLVSTKAADLYGFVTEEKTSSEQTAASPPSPLVFTKSQTLASALPVSSGRSLSLLTGNAPFPRAKSLVPVKNPLPTLPLGSDRSLSNFNGNLPIPLKESKVLAKNGSQSPQGLKFLVETEDQKRFDSNSKTQAKPINVDCLPKGEDAVVKEEVEDVDDLGYNNLTFENLFPKVEERQEIKPVETNQSILDKIFKEMDRLNAVAVKQEATEDDKKVVVKEDKKLIVKDDKKVVVKVPKNYQCDRCSKTFRFPSQLKMHRLVHAAMNQECRLCKKWFRSDRELKQHMEMHAGKKPYGCKKCNEMFKTQASMERHCRGVHGKKN